MEIPKGVCQCGCNQPTNIIEKTTRKKGLVKGEPRKFLVGHSFKNIKGNKHPGWRGGKIERKGYVYIYCPEHPNATKQGYMAEHRLVLEKELGRYLTKDEVPHHINGEKKDNRPENLRLCKSKGKHVIAEDHVARNSVNGQFISPIREAHND